MPKFRKKPVVIEAVQFWESNEVIDALSDLGLDPIRISYETPSNPVLKIDTMEGEMIAQLGDWIIKGVNGEFYPCKPDIFEKTYEPVGSFTTLGVEAYRDTEGQIKMRQVQIQACLAARAESENGGRA